MLTSRNFSIQLKDPTAYDEGTGPSLVLGYGMMYDASDHSWQLTSGTTWHSSDKYNHTFVLFSNFFVHFDAIVMFIIIIIINCNYNNNYV